MQVANCNSQGELPTRLRAQAPGSAGYDFVEQVYEKIARDYFGFAWRHTPFIRLRDKVSLEDIRILWENDQPVGYALNQVDKNILNISNLLLKPGMDVAEAVVAVVSGLRTAYVQVHVSRPVEIASLRRAGYRVAHPNWSAFMIKPLVPEVSVEDARRLLGIGTDRFLISWLDTT